jgi:hypothetical protein
MAGRKGKVPLNDLRVVFSKYKDFFNGSIPPISNEIYDHIQQNLRLEFNHEITKGALQMSAKRNQLFFFGPRENCGDDRGLLQTIGKPTSDLIISFEINKYEYYKIAPIESHHLVQNKWTNEIQDHIYFKTDLDCTFSFKNNYVPTDLVNDDIKCTGSCTQCKANLLLKISPRTVDDSYKVTLDLTNFKKDYIHDSRTKNKLTSNRVNFIKDKLKHEKPLKVRNLLADEMMRMYNTKEPSTLPKLKNLRKYRYESKSALQFDRNTILSLYSMACSPPYDNFIKKLSLVPFILYFWTIEQSIYYDDILQDKYKILSIDATGSLFKPIKPPEANDFLKYKKYKHVFLYAIVAYTSGPSVPICYMCSDSHTTETIATWLNTWLNRRVIPNEIICDDSSALIAAIIKTFLKTHWTDYLRQCFSIVEEKKGKVPACYIRLDKSHFLKKLYTQSCFNNTSEKCKYFYINCIKLIQQSRSYDTVKLIIKDIISISLHEYNSIDLDNTESKCVQAFKRLSTQLNTHLIDTDKINECEEVLENKDLVTEDEDVEQHGGLMPLIKYYDDILNTELLYLQLIETTQTKNDLFLPEINNTLKRLLKKLPMWGNIMTDYFPGAKDYASSSNVESHFKDIKTIYFNTKVERVRIDEFLVQHYSFVNGTVKLSSSQILHEKITQNKEERALKLSCNKIVKRKSKDINLDDSPRNLVQINKQQRNTIFSEKPYVDIKSSYTADFEIQSIFQNKPIEIENWRGLVVPAYKSKKLSPIYILQNGNVANSTLLQNKALITNTCAFDSVAQAFGVAFQDRPNFREIVVSASDNLTTFLKVLSTTKKNSKRLYGLRDKLLTDAFETTRSQQNIINCACNITKILQDIFTNHIYFSATRQKYCSNITCSYQQNKVYCKYIALDLNIIAQKGIKFLQESAKLCLNSENNALCTVCEKGHINFMFNLNHLLFFELHDMQVNLNDIPINIELNGQQYIILSIVDFDPPSNSTLIGHYRAYCFRTKTHNYECYDDLFSKLQKCQNIVMPHMLIYLLA